MTTLTAAENKAIARRFPEQICATDAVTYGSFGESRGPEPTARTFEVEHAVFTRIEDGEIVESPLP